MGDKSKDGLSEFDGHGNAPTFDALTAALRQMHDSIVDEPVPDDFLDILERIDAKVSAKKKPV